MSPPLEPRGHLRLPARIEYKGSDATWLRTEVPRYHVLLPCSLVALKTQLSGTEEAPAALQRGLVERK